MAAGDLKGKCEIIQVDAGTTVAIGNIVHIETDGYWDPTGDGDKGKFGVALDAATSEGDDIRVVVWGPVEVVAGDAVKKGGVVMASSTAGAAVMTDHGAVGENVGTAMEAAAQAGTFTLFVGMVD